ncbi:MAG TPA: hypothetical protein VNV88_10735, partial [Candidatus Solibacter sp.]|nr:hypothetical protein [Candidatus Solibacter sp.]
MKTFLVVLILIILLAIITLSVLSATPVITLPASLSALGQSTPVGVHISSPHGIRSITAYVEQNGNRSKVWETTQPARRIFWQRGVADGDWIFKAGTQSTPQLKDGKAHLIIEATSNDFRGKTASVDREVVVVTRPPSVSADQDQHYLYLGMADLATFNLSGYWTEAGVRVGNQTFRAWPMPDGKPGFFSLYAFAWNMPAGTAPVVYATNPGGNEATSHIQFQFPKSEQPKYRVRDLPLDDRFIEKVVNELD